MLTTIHHNDTCAHVVAAKLLTGYLSVTEKVEDPAAFVDLHDTCDASFVAYVCAWQREHGLTPDGVIGPATWRAIAGKAPTCSTAKNRTSGAAMAVQLLLDGANLSADAVFGTRTKAAVAAFQASMGLSPDGICGSKTWAALITGERGVPAPVTPGTFKQPVDYKQGDSRWGKKMYSNHGAASQTMANSGCGPTSMADIVATLKDASVNPYTLAQLSMKWGTRTYSDGTAWGFFAKVQAHYGFSRMIQTTSLATLKACLDAGGYVVCSMGPGYWTKGGHFICAWKYDDAYIYCNDPASSTRKRQSQTDFVRQRKQFFCFYA